MSEYQYYEFQAVDRPLTPQQMAELRSYSSRAQITPSSFVNVYNWGDFKGDPNRWMEKYFDAFLYLANWGSRWLMLRLPKRLLDPEVAAAYCFGDSLSGDVKGEHLILSFSAEEEEYEWVEGEGWLTSLIPLRADLLRGDHRALYLGWLCAVQIGEIDNEQTEPAVPPGLGDLNAPLGTLAEFLHIDADLITAAAESSANAMASGLAKKDLVRWVADLPAEEKDALLTQMIELEDPHIAAALRQRAMSEIQGSNKAEGSARRTVGDLLARAEVLAEERHRKETEQLAQKKARLEREYAEKRRKHLESLIGQEESLWAQVDTLIATKQPKRYDEAVSLLQDLHDLAEKQDQGAAFSLRMNALYDEHARKKTLIDRFRKAKLLA